MEKYMNMPVLLGNITSQEIKELKLNARKGCQYSSLILKKYYAEIRMTFAEFGL